MSSDNPDPSSSVNHLSRLRKDLEKRPVRTSLEPVQREAKKIAVGSFNPEIVQIVGSNGKGSVVHYTERMLKRRKTTVVSYTSPHLNNITERIRLNARPLSEDTLNNLLSELSQSVLESFTPFERLFLASLLFARREEADVLLLEAGMGGRWDATSAVASDWTVLTSVDYEHTQFLGPSRNDILNEQIHAVSENTRLIAPELSDKPLKKTILETLRRKQLTGLRVSPSGGEADALNRRLALMLSRCLTSIKTEDLNTVLRELERPAGRKEIITFRGRKIILDVAHTPAAINGWINFTRRTAESSPTYYLYGSLRGKEVTRITTLLNNNLQPEKLWLTRPPTNRALDPTQILDRWETTTKKPTVVPNPDEAFDLILRNSKLDSVISLAGSFKLVGHFRSQWV